MLHSPSTYRPAPARAAVLLLATLAIISFIMACITRGTYDSGDSINHYLYAHYAFQHPLNLLDSWAKPLFTLLAAGPAQFGWLGMKFFQCTVVAASAWCAFVVARALRLPTPALAILLCYAATDYFLIQFSGLTEPLFGLVLVGAVALAVTGRPAWSAALISWLPFVRSEGFIIIGIWVVWLAWQRQWRCLPLLVLGYAVYSAIGAVVLGEPGWVFGRNPYAKVSVYGHGEWGQFLRNIPNLLGWVITVFFAVGGVRMVRDCFRPEQRTAPLFSAKLLLVYGSITVFVAAHSAFWALGLFNSAGLARVLAVTTPLAAVVALSGLTWLSELGRTAEAQRRIRLAGAVAAVLFLFTGARNAFRWQRDFTPAPDQQVAEQAAKWVRRTYVPTPPLSCDFPYLAFVLHHDPFDTQTHPSIVQQGATHPELLPTGALLFWDSWFSRVEAHLSLRQLQQDSAFRQRWEGALPHDPRHPERDSTRIVVFEKVR